MADIYLKEIVKYFLEKNGYDGLYDDDIECGCDIDDLMPCGEPGENCKAGVKKYHPIGIDCDYIIGPKEEKTNEPK